jgi:hypothetical protein
VTPIEYETQVAKIFEEDDFIVKVTGRTGDLGVDIIAIRGTERLAIQAKMYGAGRRVNAEMVLQLEGARRYFDCTGAVIATDGALTPSAQQVAEKLNVEVRKIAAIAPTATVPDDRASVGGLGERDDFDRIWIDHILPLKGQVLQTLGQHVDNVIKSVDSHGITRISSNGQTQFIPIEIFRWAINICSSGLHLWQKTSFH